MQVRPKPQVLMLRLAPMLAIRLPLNRKPQLPALTPIELEYFASPIKFQNQLEEVRENFVNASNSSLR